MTMEQRDALSLREPDGYVYWSASEKADWLWTRVVLGSAHNRTDLPPLALPFRTAPLTEARIVLSRSELEKALTRTSDLMEPGRPKLIHARGSVAQIELVPSRESVFTGLLSAGTQGGARGLIRMSLVARVFGDAAYTPAMAVKFLIDGAPSADVLAMNHTVGQGRDYDLFANDLTNDLSDTHDELRTAQKVMSLLFRRVSRQPRRMVSTHLATQLSSGSTVDDPRSPDRLVFRPSHAAQSVFTNRAGVDFRLVLSELEPGTVLYDVDGVLNGKVLPVGALRLSSQFTSSDGGDRLFFRHVHDPADHKR